jgi:hypothetical protein
LPSWSREGSDIQQVVPKSMEVRSDAIPALVLMRGEISLSAKSGSPVCRDVAGGRNGGGIAAGENQRSASRNLTAH